MTTEKASEGVISTLKGFSLNAKEVNNIVDVISKIENTQPIDAAGLFEGLERSGSALAAAGNTYQQAAAMITAANSVVQDPSGVGTGFKTLAARIRGAKNELEEAGEDTEGMYETTSKLRKEVLGIAGVDLMKDANTFKSTFQILDELSDKWQSLSDIQKASLTEILAGKRQANMFNALMNNFDIARSALAGSETAGGYSNEALARKQEGIEYSTQKFKASFQELSHDVIDSGLIKTFVDMGNVGVQAIDKTTKATSGLSLVLGAAGLLQVVQKLRGKDNLINMFTDSAKAALKAKPAIETAADSMDEWAMSAASISGDMIAVGAGTGVKAGGLAALLPSAAAIAGVVAVLGVAAVAVSKYQHEVVEARERMEEARQAAAGNIADATSKFETSSSTIENVSERYARLSEGVRQAGNEIKNVSLTPDEFEEFLSLNKQIADVAPDLVSGYDAQGNALLNLGSGYDAVTQSLEEYIEKARELQNLTVSENYQDLYNGTVENIRDVEAGQRAARGETPGLTKIMKKRSVSGDTAKEYERTLRAANLQFTKTIIDESSDSWEFIVTSTQEEIDAAMSNLVNTGEARIDEMWSDVSDALQKTLSLSDGYKAMSDEAEDAFNAIFANLDFNEISKIAGNDEDGMQAWIQNHLITPLNNSDGLVSDAMEGLFDLQKVRDLGYISGTEYLSRLNAAMSNASLQGLDENVQNAIREAFTFKSASGATIDEMAQNLGERFSKITGRIISGDIFKDLSLNTLASVFENSSDVERQIGGIVDALKQYSAAADKLGYAPTGASAEYDDLADALDAVQYAAQGAGMSAMDYLQSYSTGNAVQQQQMLTQAIEDTIHQQEILDSYGFSTSDRSDLENYEKNKGKSGLDDYKTYVEMLKRGKELADQGLTGGAEFKSIAKAFSEAGFEDLKNWIENSKDLGKYLTDGADGLDAFLKKSSQLKDSEGNPFATLSEDGKTWDLNLEHMEEWADQLNIPMQMFQSFLKGLQEYGFVGDYFGNLEEGEQRLTELTTQRAQEQQKLNEMTADGSTYSQEQIAAQEQVVRDLDDRITEVTGGIKDMKEDAIAAGDEIDKSHEASVKSMQDLVNDYNEALQDTSNPEVADSLRKSIEDYEGQVNIPVHFDPETGKADLTETLVAEADQDIEKIQGKLEKLKTKGGGKLDMDDAEVQQTVSDLQTAIEKKQQLEQPAIMSVDTSGLNVEDGEAVKTVQQFVEVWNHLDSLNKQEELGIKVDKEDLANTQQEADNLASELQGMSDTPILIKAKIDTSSGNASEIASQVQGADMPTIEAAVKVQSLDKSELTEEGVINFVSKVTKTLPHDATHVDGVINFAAHVAGLTASDLNKHGTITYHKRIDGDHTKGGTVTVADGTAHVNGTALASGTALKGGDWGIKGNGVALGAELGPEILVRQGKWYTIGEDGAEFFNYKAGDIVFNAVQSQMLLKYGKITHGKKRATALAAGTAYAEGSIAPSGRAFAQKLQGPSLPTSVKKAVKQTQTGGKKRTGGGNNDDNKDDHKKKDRRKKKSKSRKNTSVEIFDWIELAIDTIERRIKNLDRIATSKFASWHTRLTKVDEEIKNVREEIDKQSQGAARYDKQARDDSKKFSEKTKSKKKNKRNRTRNDKLKKYKGIIDDGGTIDISKIKDSALAKKVKAYQDWKQKANECRDAVEELKETEKELYQQKFDDIQQKYDDELANYEHRADMLDQKIAMAEARGHFANESYYRDLIANGQKSIKVKQDELADLKEQRALNLKKWGLDEKSVELSDHAEAWAKMNEAINDTTLAIEKDKVQLKEWDNDIRQLEWDQFDMIRERVSNLTKESDFMVDLMSHQKLFKDSGQFNDLGMASMGSHAMNYDLYMNQADAYKKEADSLKEVAKTDKEAAKRRQELLDLQRQMIQSANQEKEAIKDLVEEGIRIELDNLKKLIDERKDALSAEKDLYEYQKKVKKQTEEIGDLEKQIAAYRGDTSDEARAKVQELTVKLNDAKEELEETEYDKFVDDTREILDTLYDEYEETLNSRLDNIDQLLSEMIAATNENAATIKTTLEAEAGKVGVDLSTHLSNLWTADGAGKVVGMYKESIENIKTTVNSIAAEIPNYIDGNQNAGAKKDTASTPADTPKKTQRETNIDKISNFISEFTKLTGQVIAAAKKGDDKTADKLADKQKKMLKDSGFTSISAAEKALALLKDPDKLKRVRADYMSKRKDYVRYQAERARAKQNSNKYINAQNQMLIAKAEMDELLRKYGFTTEDQFMRLGFKSGKQSVSRNGARWTQENGEEYIIRPSDGAILTPLARNDSVLTASASQNLWQMANDPAKFIADNMHDAIDKSPALGSMGNNVTQNFENVTFSMPNVRNYDQLIAQMQSDRNFERLILSMSVDRLAGASRLAKTKAIR